MSALNRIGILFEIAMATVLIDSTGGAFISLTQGVQFQISF